MKKIMFNDKYGLTEAVLERRKTQTRRIIKCPSTFKGEYVAGFNVHIRQSDKKIIDYPCIYDADEREFDMGEILPKSKVGEVVAIAQSYVDCGNMPDSELDEDGYPVMPKRSGFWNKMFVKAELMPHHIRIINVRVERLQDISDEDCMKEGITFYEDIAKYYFERKDIEEGFYFNSAKQAYASLIDKISGKGTWESNPFVFVYEFELVD